MNLNKFKSILRKISIYVNNIKALRFIILWTTILILFRYLIVNIFLWGASKNCMGSGEIFMSMVGFFSIIFTCFGMIMVIAIGIEWAKDSKSFYHEVRVDLLKMWFILKCKVYDNLNKVKTSIDNANREVKDSPHKTNQEIEDLDE
jgi:hypothetical protein